MAQGDLTRIASNISGLNALNALKAINTKLGVHQLRLSTGKRINEAADDPAGLTIATKFNAKSRGLGVALDNIGDAKNFLAVAEGGLNKINDILLLIRDKAEQAANDALGDAERTAIKDQIQALLDEIDTIVDETEWNGQRLLAGNLTPVFQTGFQSRATTEVDVLQQKHDVASLSVSLDVPAIERAVQSLKDLTSDTLLVSSGFAAATPMPGATELASGNYMVEVDWDYTDSTTNGIMKVTLRDSAGNIVKIDDPGQADFNGVDTAQVTVTAGSTVSTTYDTGLGFTITFQAFTALPTQDMSDRMYGIQYTAYTAAVPGGAVSSNERARDYMDRIDAAIAQVSTSIKNIGAVVSRLTFKEENLIVAKTNTEAAYNRIMNADIAAEQLEAMKYQILQQTATAMLAQANVAPQAVLGLFR